MERIRSCFSIVSGLPCVNVRSAPAIALSRPAQRSLSLRPARSLNRRNDPFHRRLQQLRYLHCCFDCYRVERTSSRAGLAPAEVQRLFTAHVLASYRHGHLLLKYCACFTAISRPRPWLAAGWGCRGQCLSTESGNLDTPPVPWPCRPAKRTPVPRRDERGRQWDR